MTERKYRMQREFLVDYMENVLNFRSYYFKKSKFWGKYNKARSINLLNPNERDLDNAVSDLVKDGFSRIIIYLGE